MNPHHETLLHLRLLAGQQPAGRYLELRYAPPGRDWMRRTTIPARQPARAARAISRLAQSADVYIGAALRHGTEHGGASAIDASHLIWVDIDEPDAVDRLQRFAHPASLIASSGRAGHAHAYWQLTTPATPDQLEAANRKLAHHLGGDPASVDLARVLRPCGSLNHKRTPPARVRGSSSNGAFATGTPFLTHTDRPEASRASRSSVPEPHPGDSEDWLPDSVRQSRGAGRNSVWVSWSWMNPA